MTATRDAMDTYSASDVVPFVATLLPTVLQLVKSGEPIFERDAPEQQLRHLILETIHRMPANEHVRPLAPEITLLMIHIMRTDNEDNAVAAIKVVLDMYRGHRQVLDTQVKAFMEVILEIFKDVPSVIQSLIETPPQASPAAGSSPPKGGEVLPPLQPGMRSFRVLADLPLATAMFGAAHHQLVGELVKVRDGRALVCNSGG